MFIQRYWSAVYFEVSLPKFPQIPGVSKKQFLQKCRNFKAYVPQKTSTLQSDADTTKRQSHKTNAQYAIATSGNEQLVTKNDWQTHTDI
jgi:hypothetical protein